MKCNETIIVFFITYCSYCILCKLAKVFLCKSYSLYQTEKRFSVGAILHNKCQEHKVITLEPTLKSMWTI